jgi:hypothetical protein
MTRILLTGVDGQLGQELQRTLASLGEGQRGWAPNNGFSRNLIAFVRLSVNSSQT